jgi:hypothetical protein
MKYYVEDAEQTPEVQKKLEEIRYKDVNPEDIRIIENKTAYLIQFKEACA